MSDYPRLKEMGVQNPDQIEKFTHYTVGETDVLRIVYRRKPGSFLPVSRRYKFPLVKKKVLHDAATGLTQPIYESLPAFREVLNELERLQQEHDDTGDVAAQIRQEMQHLEEDVTMRLQHIKTLLDRM